MNSRSSENDIIDNDTIANELIEKKLDVNIYERENEYIAQIQATGFDKDEILVYIEENTLYVEASRQDILDVEDDEYHIQEHNSAYCQRSFSLKGINKSEINAYYEDCLIYIHFPKIGLSS